MQQDDYIHLYQQTAHILITTIYYVAVISPMFWRETNDTRENTYTKQ